MSATYSSRVSFTDTLPQEFREDWDALRPLQQEALELLFNWSISPNKNKTPLATIALATGMGKTRIGALFSKMIGAKGGKVLWLTHRDNLVEQTSNSFLNLGVDTDIEKAALVANTSQKDINAVVASVHTLKDGRLDNFKRKFKPDYILIDEAQHVNTESFARIKAAYPGVPVVNFTATPYNVRKDGVLELAPNMGELLILKTLQDGIDAGILKPAMSLNLVAGSLLTHVPEELQATLKQRSSLIYCKSLEHCNTLKETLATHGFKFEIIDYTVPAPLRREFISQVKNGELDGLLNFNTLTEGTDIPEIDMVINLRSNDEPYVDIQIMGRGSRVTERNGKGYRKSNFIYCKEYSTAEPYIFDVNTPLLKSQQHFSYTLNSHNGKIRHVSLMESIAHSLYKKSDLRNYYEDPTSIVCWEKHPATKLFEDEKWHDPELSSPGKARQSVKMFLESTRYTNIENWLADQYDDWVYIPEGVGVDKSKCILHISSRQDEIAGFLHFQQSDIIQDLNLLHTYQDNKGKWWGKLSFNPDAQTPEILLTTPSDRTAAFYLKTPNRKLISYKLEKWTRNIASCNTVTHAKVAQIDRKKDTGYLPQLLNIPYTVSDSKLAFYTTLAQLNRGLTSSFLFSEHGKKIKDFMSQVAPLIDPNYIKSKLDKVNFVRPKNLEPMTW